MSTSRLSIFKFSSLAVLPRRLSLPVILLVPALWTWQAGIPAEAQQTEEAWSSIPFLDLFARHATAPAPTEQFLQLDAGGNPVAAYVVTPAVQGRWPAVLLAPGREGLTESFRQFAREIAGIGYVALAVDYRGDQDAGSSPLLREIAGHSNDLAAVADWLAMQSMVDSERIGAIGWNDTFASIVRLADTGKVKAAVVTGSAICADVEPLFQVRSVPVLLIAQGGGPNCTSVQARLRTSNLPHTIAVYPEREMTGQAWVEIYEFLGKRVEDARVTESPVQPEVRIARIVDIMRAITSDQGIRGRLARTLTTAPAGAAEPLSLSDDQWEQARSDAAIVAEAGNLLLAERPPRGSLTGWRKRATDFRGAAQTVLRAVEARDVAAAQQALRELPQTCAACHLDYR